MYVLARTRRRLTIHSPAIDAATCRDFEPQGEGQRVFDVRLFTSPSRAEWALKCYRSTEACRKHKISIAPRVNAARPERDGCITVGGYHGNCPPARFPRSLHPPPGSYFDTQMYDKSKCIGDTFSSGKRDTAVRARARTRTDANWKFLSRSLLPREM